jgi:hypothetical protein
MQESGVLGIALTHQDDPQNLAVERELGLGHDLRHDTCLGQLTGESAAPVRQQALVSGLVLRSAHDFGSREPAGFREVLLQAGQPAPMVAVAVRDVDPGQPFAESAHPFRERIDLFVGDERVHQDGFFFPRDQCAAHR